MFPKINQPGSLNSWNTELTTNLFNSGHNEEHLSAIDSFHLKNKEINQLIVDPSGKMNDINEMIINGEIREEDGRAVLAHLSTPNTNSTFLNFILLGYVSSVEAFIRKLIREIINLDTITKENCQNCQIDFGATYYQEAGTYPDSLMSHTSFIKSETIINECCKLLGIKKQKIQNGSINQAFIEFDSLCQLRHCIIHRFGKVGVQNLMALGLHREDFKNCIEKPIQLNFTTIQKISKITVNLVRELNHALWVAIMERLRDSDPQVWTWDFRTDKKLFTQYLKIFYDTDLGVISSKLYPIYNAYRLTKND